MTTIMKAISKDSFLGRTEEAPMKMKYQNSMKTLIVQF